MVRLFLAILLMYNLILLFEYLILNYKNLFHYVNLKRALRQNAIKTSLGGLMYWSVLSLCIFVMDFERINVTSTDLATFVQAHLLRILCDICDYLDSQLR